MEPSTLPNHRAGRRQFAAHWIGILGGALLGTARRAPAHPAAPAAGPAGAERIEDLLPDSQGGILLLPPRQWNAFKAVLLHNNHVKLGG